MLKVGDIVRPKASPDEAPCTVTARMDKGRVMTSGLVGDMPYAESELELVQSGGTAKRTAGKSKKR